MEARKINFKNQIESDGGLERGALRIVQNLSGVPRARYGTFNEQLKKQRGLWQESFAVKLKLHAFYPKPEIAEVLDFVDEILMREILPGQNFLTRYADSFQNIYNFLGNQSLIRYYGMNQIEESDDFKFWAGKRPESAGLPFPDFVFEEHFD